MADVEEGFNKLKAENNARLKPLQEMVKQGEILTAAEERLMDQTGNMINEFMMVERLKEDGNIARAASRFTDAEKEVRGYERAIRASVRHCRLLRVKAAKQQTLSDFFLEQSLL